MTQAVLDRSELVEDKNTDIQIVHLYCPTCRPDVAACGHQKKAKWSEKARKGDIRCVVCRDLQDDYAREHLLKHGLPRKE